jgi:hypothetical protein
LGLKAVERTAGRLHFSLGVGPGVEGLDFADFVDDVIAGH